MRCIILLLFHFLPYSEHKTCRHGDLQETYLNIHHDFLFQVDMFFSGWILKTLRRYTVKGNKKYSNHCQLWSEYPFKYLESASLVLWGWDMGNNTIHNCKSVFYLLAFAEDIPVHPSKELSKRGHKLPYLNRTQSTKTTKTFENYSCMYKYLPNVSNHRVVDRICRMGFGHLHILELNI